MDSVPVFQVPSLPSRLRLSTSTGAQQARLVARRGGLPTALLRLPVEPWPRHHVRREVSVVQADHRVATQ